MDGINHRVVSEIIVIAVDWTRTSFLGLCNVLTFHRHGDIASPWIPLKVATICIRPLDLVPYLKEAHMMATRATLNEIISSVRSNLEVSSRALL